MSRYFRLVWAAVAALASLSFVAGAGAQTRDQLEILKSLPDDQREALMKQILGDTSGVDVRDRKLKFPETVLPKTPEELERQRRNEEMFGEPRLQGGDTVLIRLEIREFTGPDEPVRRKPLPQAAEQLQQGQQQIPSNNNDAVQETADRGLPATLAPRERIIRTAEERKRIEDLRDRIQRRNPYRLDRSGRLNVPELGSIALAGLTVEEAQQRLAVETTLAPFVVRLARLPLEPIGDERLKPFGYDLFSGVPSTFAPATDVPVPADYVVGPGDQIEVQLFGNTNKRYSLVVGRDGQINFPELGPINVSGQSFSRMRQALEQRVASQMIGVRASVSMGDTRSIRVFVLGEVERPGSYTVSGLSTITNALFAGGGVKEIGSLRNVQLKRSGALVTTLDLYDLLLRGDTSGDARLLPGDVIFVPPVEVTVSVSGEVHRPAIYEIKGKGTAKELLYLAGGLTPQADPQISRLERIDERRQRVVLDLDLTTPEGRERELQTGDVLRVSAIRTVMEDSVALEGHVHRPGQFQYRPGMRLSDVLPSFDDLKPHADIHYVLIRREAPRDRAVSILSADLARALAGPKGAADIELAPRDRITVFDLEGGRDRIVAPLIDELRLQAKLNQPLQVVSVGGRIKAPGQYPLENGMRITDLIRAGGSLEDAAYSGGAELVRYTAIDGEYRQTELIDIDLAAVLRGDPSANLQLEPYDYLNIKELPQWRDQEEIEIGGEVRFPGRYPIKRGETLRSVLQRAGGLTELAFPEGSIFLREDLKKREQRQIEILASRMQTDIAVLALQATQAAVGAQSSQALSIGQSLLTELRNTQAVGRLVLNLEAIMASAPGSSADIVLKSGDRLLIPKKTQEVTVLGEVQTATSHLYQPGLTRDEYINLSGGTTQKADAKRIYVVRASGSVVASSNGWFKRSGAQMRPGDTIVVPLDAERMRPLPLWTAVTQIVYNLAIAAAAVSSF